MVYGRSRFAIAQILCDRTYLFIHKNGSDDSNYANLWFLLPMCTISYLYIWICIQIICNFSVAMADVIRKNLQCLLDTIDGVQHLYIADKEGV